MAVPDLLFSNPTGADFAGFVSVNPTGTEVICDFFKMSRKENNQRTVKH